MIYRTSRTGDHEWFPYYERITCKLNIEPLRAGNVESDGCFIMKLVLTLLILLTVFSLNTFAQDFPYISLEGHTSRITKIVFSSDSATLASTSEDRTIRLWDVAARTHRHTLIGHNSHIYSVAFSPDGATLASGGENGRIRFWNVTTGQYRVTLEGHSSSVRSVVFSPDGKTLASASSDRTIRLWNATTGQYRVTLEGHSESINSVVFSPDGKTLVSGSSDRTIRLWNATTGFHKQTLIGHTNSIYDISFIENGQTLASKSNDGTIRLWDTATGQHKETLSVDNLRNVSINSDGTMLAGVYSSRNISLWDIATESEITSLTGHTSDIYHVTFSPNGKTLATGSSDRTVRLWDLSTRVNITPSTIESPPIGQQFSIDINIVGGQDVRGYEIIVEYDHNSLNYVSHAHGDYLSDKVYKGPIIRKLGKVSFSNVSTADVGEGDGTLATITFKVISRRASTISLSAILSNSDGVRLPYIVISGKVIEPPWDVNGDGSVDILDLSYVAARFGDKDEIKADINKDGIVDIKDLITVASGMGREAAAPALHYHSFKKSLTRETVQQWITEAQQLNLTDPTSQKGILFLEYLLASLTPEKTALLPNYPNPFNPETWIPYQLTQSADITISIYTVDGTMVRILDLGHRSSGIYHDKTRAAYWDGKNIVGESVASGVYFYTLSAGDFTATRKMIILK